MRLYKDVVGVGDIMFFNAGNDNRMISHTVDGKVVICKNKLEEGYARVLTVDERKTCFLVTAEHVVKEMYENMKYLEFVEVLKLYGFKIGFEEPFTRKTLNRDVGERLLYAYKPNGMVVVAQTFTLTLDTVVFEPRLEWVTVYCPNLSVHGVSDKLYKFVNQTRSTNDMTIFELADDTDLNAFSSIMRLMDRINRQLLWPVDEYPWLTARGSEDDLDERSTSIERLASVPESLMIYKGCRFLEEIKNFCKREDRNCMACDCYKVCMCVL